MASEFVFTGNEVSVFIDGVECALLQNISGSDDYGHEPASGIGDIHVKEYVPALARHNISIDRLILRKADLMAKGIVFENGDAALVGKTFDIEVFSKSPTAPRLLRKFINCVNTGGRVSVAAHRILVSDATFVGTDASGTLSA
jgi:hypothetical protein